MTSNITTEVSPPRAAMAIFMAMCVLFGIVGNAVVIFIFSYEATLRKACNIFIIHLAMIDIIISSYNTVGSSLLMGRGTQSLPANTTLCTVVGVITCIIYNVSIAALTVIAIHRYISILRPMENRRIFSGRNCFLFCGAVWIYDGLVCLPPGLGWGRVIFKAESKFCMVDRNFHPTYIAFAWVFQLVIPSIITIFCYTSLYLKVRKSKRQVQGQSRVQGFRKTDLKMALQMFIIVVFLYATWGPYLCVTQIDDPGTPRGIILLITALVGMNSMINPFVYIYFNSAFRAAFMKFFCPCRKPETAVDVDGVVTENDISIPRHSTGR